MCEYKIKWLNGKLEGKYQCDVADFRQMWKVLNRKEIDWCWVIIGKGDKKEMWMYWGCLKKWDKVAGIGE